MADKQPGAAARALNLVIEIATGHDHILSKLIPIALFLADALLCALVIWKVPYTEIDWTTYMQHIDQFVHGERDYSLIKGDTGPMVYPAAHVYTYQALYYVTDKGQSIFTAQVIFAFLYMATLGVVMACYWQAKVPPYVYPLLILSKRLHSIFVLRLFNDCWATFFLWLSIFLFQRRHWNLGSAVYAWGLGIKMSLLLVLPAVGAVSLLGRGFTNSLASAAIIGQVQFLMAQPFVLVNWRAYLGHAYEFTRQFFFKWTVNWRFVGEAVFLSKPFSLFLLSLHVSVLFLLIRRWLVRSTGKSLFSGLVIPMLALESPFTPREEARLADKVTPDFVMSAMLSANVVGLLFARSLHYQFYSYLMWSTPYLLWRTGTHPVLIYGLWALQEWAWNVFPSTPVSSGVVVGVMATTVGLVLLRGDGTTATTTTRPAASSSQQKPKKS